MIAKPKWTFGPPPTPVMIERLVKAIPNLPNDLLCFYREHNGAHGPMMDGVDPSMVALYDIDCLIDTNQSILSVRTELAGYVIFGHDGYYYMVVNADESDKTVYQILPIDDSPPCESDRRFESISQLLSLRDLD
ncbi:MAG: SMI1/KNR4 family protein [Candidatus Obscuribacter sp.]|nr:SMI1/KNR4 family protein [Candidatus Obscuribacter sp.]